MTPTAKLIAVKVVDPGATEVDLSQTIPSEVLQGLTVGWHSFHMVLRAPDGRELGRKVYPFILDKNNGPPMPFRGVAASSRTHARRRLPEAVLRDLAAGPGVNLYPSHGQANGDALGVVTAYEVEGPDALGLCRLWVSGKFLHGGQGEAIWNRLRNGEKFGLSLRYAETAAHDEAGVEVIDAAVLVHVALTHPG